MANRYGNSIITLLVIMTCRVTLVPGFSTGIFPSSIRDKACVNMFPGHGVDAQTTTPPYTLDTPDTYTPGQQITVTLRSTDSSTFKGFMLQARRVADNSLVGQFAPIDNTKQNCDQDRALSHDSKVEKSNLQLVWTAPDAGVGDIKFLYTVVKVAATLWVKISSNALTDATGSPDPPTTTSTTTPPPRLPTQDPLPEVDSSDCEVTKSCYRFPQDCVGDCEFIVTWTKDGEDMVMFEMQANAPQEDYYIAMGLSRDNRMGDDSVTECTYSTISLDYIGVFMSFNGVHFNQPLGDRELGLVPGSRKVFYKDGKVICQYKKFVNVAIVTTTTATPVDAVAAAQTSGSDQVFSLDGSYTLLVAKGNLASTGGKQKHANTWQAPVAINFTSDQLVNLGGSAGFLMIKIHGVIMIVAWMISASIAIQIPRYHKNTWVDTWCGKAIWFQLHQPLMVIAMLLTIAGFIVIFVFVGGYSELNGAAENAHPALGIVTTALVIINPLMAACRPHPGAPKRPMFKIAHSLVGFCAHGCAVSCMFLAVSIGKVGAPRWSFWVMVAFACWQGFFDITLAIFCCCRHKKRTPEEKYEMNHGNSHGETVAEPPKGSKFKKFMISVHALGVVGLAIALIYSIIQGEQ